MNPPTPAAISVESLVCRLGGRRALDGLSISVSTGTVVGVVGPNGSGKTTLINCLCGLLRPSSGSVTLFGLPVGRRGRMARAMMGLVPQETALYGDLTAWQNLRFSADLYGVDHARIGEVLQIVGLSERSRSRASQLSGGMQRRLAIARALLHNPPLLLLDEPTTGIDIDTRHEIWGHIRQLKSSGHAVLLTTNHLDEAEALCDRIVLLRDGKVVADEQPSVLMERTGWPLELHADETMITRLASVLRMEGAVRSIIVNSRSITVFLPDAGAAELFVRRAMSMGHIESFRTRSPDLAEIFDALGRPDAA